MFHRNVVSKPERVMQPTMNACVQNLSRRESVTANSGAEPICLCVVCHFKRLAAVGNSCGAIHTVIIVRTVTFDHGEVEPTQE